MRADYVIDGLHCDACVKSVQQAVSRLSQVASVKVTLQPPRLQLELRQPVDEQVLAKVLQTAGEYRLLRRADGLEAVSNNSINDAESRQPKAGWRTYYPLLLILAFLILVTLIVQGRQSKFDGVDWMCDFMAGFFLVFAFFKLLNLSGFASTFRRYDLVAAAIPLYAWAYPFVELALGVAYLTRWNLSVTNLITVLVMALGTVGVVRTMIQGQTVQCACLGTMFSLPVSTATLIENVGMGLMAAAMLMM